MTFSNEDPRPELKARVDQETRDQVEEIAERRGDSMAAVVRSAIHAWLADSTKHQTPADTPAEPKLRNSYVWLHKRANPEGEIPTSDAINGLAQKHGMDKEWIKVSILQPLQERAWVIPKYSKMRILDSNERGQLRDSTQ